MLGRWSEQAARLRHSARRVVAGALMYSLVACGGGGGAGELPDDDVRPPLPQLVTDTLPDGVRLDLRDKQYFVAVEGDKWVYDRLDASGAGTPAAVTRTLTAVSVGGFTVTESQQGLPDEVERYVRSGDGLQLLDPAGDGLPTEARAMVGQLLLYPEPFYAVGATRTLVRQGSLGIDTDGDGVVESFRVELTQTLVGFETVTPPVGSFEAAHFRTTLTLTLSPSSLAISVSTISGTEDSWWAPGMGLVQARRVQTDAAGARESYTLSLSQAVRQGSTLPAQVADGTVRVLPLLHRALVFDPLRQRYYATMSSQAGVHAHQIATIDANTGLVNYSAAVGASPSVLALAPDASAIYVALDDSAQLIKLALPDLTEIWRLPLPVNSGDGTPLLARAIVASPAEPDALAVSLRSIAGGGNFPGVVLVRHGVVQPRQIGYSPLYTMGPLAFDGDGSRVYSYGNNFGDATLFALVVQADGLAVAAQTSNTTGHGVLDVDWMAQGIIASRGFYSLSDLTQLAVFAPYGCRVHGAAPARLVCISQGMSSLTVIDAAARTELRNASYANLSFHRPFQLVPGPAGQVGMRLNTQSTSTEVADTLWLFNSPAFE